MLSTEFLIKHLEGLGYTVYAPGEFKELSNPVSEKVAEIYAAREGLLDRQVVNRLIDDDLDLYNQAFAQLDYVQLLENWPSESLRKLDLHGEPFQFSPSLTEAKAVRSVARVILRQRGIKDTPPDTNGMQE